MNEFISKHATGLKVILFVVLANIIYALMAFVTVPSVTAYADGLKILDAMSTGYDFDYVKTLFDELGEDGRSIYLNKQIPLDLIFPFLFALSNFLLLAYLFKKINVQNPCVYYLCLIPVAAGIFDYLENFGTINLLLSYPDITTTRVIVNNYFTLLKSGFIALFFIVLIVTFFVFVYKKIKAFRTLKNQGN